MATLRIIPKQIRICDGKLIAEADCVLGNQSHEIWFRVDEAHQDCVNVGHEHLLLATLFYGMEHADSIHIEGSISPHLLASLEEFNAIWHAWRPGKYRLIDLSAANSSVPSSGGDGGVFAFSGGIDAYVTLRRHAKSLVKHRRVAPKRAVFVHGFDIPLNNSEAASLAFSRAGRICRSYSVEPVNISTNIRSLGGSWEDVFGAYISAILHFANKGCAKGVFASDEPYANPVLPWGSNPITNPYLGGVDFAIHTDGAELGRLDKVRILVESGDDLSGIRVCWEGELTGRNCGKCEKCVRTMLEMLACNVGDFNAFDSGLTSASIKSIRPRNAVQLSYLQEVFGALSSAQCQEWWAKDLGAVVHRGIYQERSSRRRLKQFIRGRARSFLGS